MAECRKPHVGRHRAFLVALALVSVGCKDTGTIGLEDQYPERANYTLVAETGSSLDSIFVILVNADGSNLRKVPSPHNITTWPLVSPDMQYVAFRIGDGSRSLWMSSLQSGQFQQILHQINWDRYAWSPDSRKIAFNGDNDGFVISILDVFTGTVESLTDTLPGQQRWPDWSPDGKTIAFTRYDNVSQRHVLAYDFAQATFRDLFRAPETISPHPDSRDIAWSPDGGYLAIGHMIHTWPDLLLHRDISSISSSGLLYPRWFPNSREILIKSIIPDPGLYRVDIESGKAIKIPSQPVAGGSDVCTISADGKLIAYIPEAPGNNVFIVMESDGSNAVEINLPIPGANYGRIRFLGDIVW